MPNTDNILAPTLAEEIEHYFDQLWPICRSITGEGLRESLTILQDIIPLQLHEVPSGTQVFDWTVPPEWNIRDAYIITPEGEKVADFNQHNLHVVNYSIPVEKQLSFAELDPHLHTKKDLPEAIPYVTSYYNRTWGFCLDYNTYKNLPREGMYEVKIDSDLDENGSLTYGDLLLKGQRDEEILFTSYLCHPSMANNELSGPLALAFLYRQLKKRSNRKYSYRFVLAPETIGALSNLYQNKDALLRNVRAGYIFTCCGDPGPITYKAAREASATINAITEHVLSHAGVDHRLRPFEPFGSDERQYGSPGFNLPVGVLMRTPYSEYPEYHTSLDNKKLIDFEKMTEFISLTLDMVRAFELNESYTNQIMFGEPFLGKRDLYEELATNRTHSDTLKMRMRLLNYLDGTRDLLAICDQFGYSILDLEQELNQLLEHKLIA